MMKIILAQLNPKVGALEENKQKILQAIEHAKEAKVDGIIFPELALIGYPPEDLLLQKGWAEACQEALSTIIEDSFGLFIVIGTIRKNPKSTGNPLFNSAAVIENGKLLGYQDKMLLPTFSVFNEKRYFESGKQQQLFTLAGKKALITICADIWQHRPELTQSRYKSDPLSKMKGEKIDLIINLAASPYHLGKDTLREQLIEDVAKSLNAPLYFCNQVGAQDSLIFDGSSVACSKQGKIIARGPSFEESLVFPHEKQTTSPPLGMEATKKALCLGIADYFRKSDFKKVALGLSGGLDSSVVACLACQALGAENVLGFAMPSRHSSEHSLSDAYALAKNLGIDIHELSIEPAHRAILEQQAPYLEEGESGANLAKENLQSRLRGLTLMTIANAQDRLVLATGNKSELAMGYATLYGDLIGALCPLGDLYKTQVYELARHLNQEETLIPQNVLDKAPSAELSPGQKDTDTLPDYELLDAILYELIENSKDVASLKKEERFDPTLLEWVARTLHHQEFKRRQAPPILRLSHHMLTPPERRIPIVSKPLL